MAEIDFSAAYRDATKGSTIKALQQRRAEAQAAIQAAQQPRQIGSPWQGAAQIGEVISGSIREGRLANQEAASRQRFAQLLAGGLAPDEIGEALGLDPETGMKFVERNWATEDAKKTAAEAERVRLQEHGWDVDAATTRLAGEKELAKQQQGAQAALQDDAQAATAGLKDVQIKADTAAALEKVKADQDAATASATTQADRDAIKIKADQDAARLVADATKAEQDRDAAAPKDPLAQAAVDLKNGLISPQEYEERKAKINQPPAGITINTGETEARKNLALELGLEPGTPAYVEYVATGNYTPPKAEAKPNAGELKVGFDQQDQYIQTSGTITDMQKAAELLRQGVHTGYTAGPMTMAGAMGVPGFDEQKAQRTKEFNNIMNAAAIERMSVTLKGATTDTEMAEFIKNMNDPTLESDRKLAFLERMMDRAQTFQQTQKARLQQMGQPIPGEGAAAPAAGENAATGGGKPADIPQAEWDVMTPEERAAFQ